MKRWLILALLCVSAGAQTTVTLTAADGTQLGDTAHPPARGGVNLVEILADSPFNKNILNGNSGDTGFEPQQGIAIWQTQSSNANCTINTWQSNINNAQFGPYTASQWVNADFKITQGPSAGYVGVVTANTASSPGTGSGAVFTVSPNLPNATCQPGDVIIISTNHNMTNIWPTPVSQLTSNSFMGAWSFTGGTTPSFDVTPADLCATCGLQSLGLSFASSSDSATVQLQTGGGVLEKSTVMNGTYTASWWLKNTGGSGGKVSGIVAARSGSSCTISSQAGSSTWTMYTATCNMNETTTGSGNAIFQLTIAANGGAGSVLFDNVSFSNNADTNPTQFTNKLVATLENMAQTSQNTTGVKPSLRYSPSPDMTTIQNLMNNEMQQMPSAEASQSNFTGGTYTKNKIGYNEFMQLCQQTGYIPKLIIPITGSTTDYAFLADWLQGTNAALPGVAARIAWGQTAPWVGSGGVFPYVYLEFGNENWNGAFIGQTEGFRSGETGGVLGDYARTMGTDIGAFRTEQTTQSYNTAQTFWIANAQTAANGSTMADTATNAFPDLFEFDGYTSFGIDSVTTSNCSSFAGTGCDLYMTAVSEAYLNTHDTNSPHGFDQSLAEATSLNTCGPSHTAQCRASVYEENVYMGTANTAGPVTQAVVNSYAMTGNQGVMAATQILENATAVFNGKGIEDQGYYHSHQFIQGVGGVNVPMWGIVLDSGGDCSVTNASLNGFGGNWCPRPQALGMEVANWAMLGFPVSCSNNSPTYTIPNMGTTNNNSLTIGQTVPYVTTYCFASTFPVTSGTTITRVFVNRDPASSYIAVFAGTNAPPSTFTVYQYASPSLTAANELGGTTNISTNVLAFGTNLVLSGPTAGVSSTGQVLPPQSVTADQFTLGGTPTAANPSFSPAAGSYGPAQTVSITCSSGGTNACYTRNGTTPAATVPGTCDAGSTTYAGSFVVSSSETDKALCTGSGFLNSSIVSAAYTINGTLATPTFTPVAGTYSSAQSVTINLPGGSVGCYKINAAPSATTPGVCDPGSTTYTTAITVSTTETIEAIATEAAFVNSAVGSAAYTITIPTTVSHSKGGNQVSSGNQIW